MDAVGKTYYDGRCYRKPGNPHNSMQYNKTHKKAFILITLLFFGQSLVAGGDGQRGRVGSVRSTVASVAGLAARAFPIAEGPGCDDDDGSWVDEHALRGGSDWSYAAPEEEEGSFQREDKVETKDEEPDAEGFEATAKTLSSRELMSPGDSRLINGMTLQAFALLNSDALAELRRASSECMRPRVRSELTRREAIYWLSRPELLQHSEMSIMRRMLWAAQIGLTELSIAPEYYEYLLEALIAHSIPY